MGNLPECLISPQQLSPQLATGSTMYLSSSTMIKYHMIVARMTPAAATAAYNRSVELG